MQKKIATKGGEAGADFFIALLHKKNASAQKRNSTSYKKSYTFNEKIKYHKKVFT